MAGPAAPVSPGAAGPSGPRANPTGGEPASDGGGGGSGDQRDMGQGEDHPGETPRPHGSARLAAHQSHRRLSLGVGEPPRNIQVSAAAPPHPPARRMMFSFCPLSVYSCPFYGVTP